MRNKTHLWKRSLAALLCFVMVLGMIPALDFAPAALAAEETPENTESNPQAQAVEAVNPDHITMPITIRDFAADGMLFEYNETGDSGIAYKNGTPGSISVYLNEDYDNSAWDAKYDYPHLWQYTSRGSNFTVSLNENWYVVFINSDGTVNRVCRGNSISDRTIPEKGMVIFAHSSAKNGPYLGRITESNKANYVFGTIVYDTGTDTSYYVNVTYYEAAYHQADTKGFGMLYTDVSDFRNNIYMWLEQGDLKGSMIAYNRPGDVPEGSSTLEKTYTVYDGSYILNGENVSFEKEQFSFTFETPYKQFGLWDYETVGGYANQRVYGATIRTNLMKMGLVDGKPVYTKDAVTYIADYLKAALATPWQNADGSYNTYYVTGYEHPSLGNKTLAEKIREQIAKNQGDEAAKLGTYQDSYNKFFGVKNEDGSWKIEPGLRTYEDIATWFDAAFFLMHNTWRDSSADDDGSDGYGKPVPAYHSLHLIPTTVDGKTTYVFNSMYTETVYSPGTGEIYNTQVEKFEQAYTNEGDEADADGNPQPVDRFDPLGMSGAGEWLGYGQYTSVDTYGDMIADSNANWADYYDETNYHLSLEGHAQFVYYEADDLYFTFTGDDDVYLYINGIRVLDIGGGHSIAKVSIRLNDVAAVCGLKDGQAYPFDFFYMERHGTAANFGIETNIQLAESSMTTTKTGYQNGSTTGYNGYVDPNTKVAYSFSLENNGNAPIYNLAFDDPAIGVYFGHDKVELNEYSELTELYLYRFNADGTVKSSYFAGNEVATEEETAEQRIVNKIMTELDAALPVGETIAIYGFKYQIPAGAWVDDTFNNTVYSAASSTENGEQDLSGKADWKVRRTNETLNKFHVYDWMAQKISKNPNVSNGWYHPEGYEGVTVTLEEIKEKTEYGDNSAAVIVPCNGAGSESEHNLNPNITLNKDANGNVVSLTYKSTIPGVDRMFFKIKNVGKDSLVFNYSIFTYGAVDNIYVLDYGLNVELNGPEFGLLANDHLEVISAPENITVNTVGISETTKTLEAYDEDDSWYVYSPNAEAEKMKTGTIEGTYGNFAFGDKISWKDEKTGESGSYLSLMYQPKEIIDNTDGVVAHIEIREPDYDPQDDLKFYGVDMYEIVTTAPASVMYYEENFPGITYVNTEKTLKVDKNGFLLDQPGAQILVDKQPIKVGDDGYLVKKDGNPILSDGKKIKIDIETGNLLNENNEVITVEGIVPVILQNKWAHYETLGTDNKPVAGTEQSADQESNYGSDPNYENNKDGYTEDDGTAITFTVDTDDANEAQAQLVSQLAKYLGLTGEDSNGTYNKLVVKATEEVMSFMFKGTGFEIVSRTTQDQYALIQVKVILWDEQKDEPMQNLRDSSGNPANSMLPGTDANGVCRTQIVITESKGGDLYQVPIIAIKDLPRAKYKVSVTASYHQKQERVLYIDGIRIYGPLSDDVALEYYNPREAGADYYEVKNLIASFNAIFAELTGLDVNNPTLGAGYTLIENVGTTEKVVLTNKNKDGKEVSLTDYLSVGPNNEIYLDGNNTTSLIAFFLDPDENVPEEQRTIQIGAHRKADSTDKAATENAGMYYGSTIAALTLDPEILATKPYYHQVKSGTEQYFDINVDYLEQGTDGRYLVLIVADESDNGEVLALTNLKLKGYEVEFLEPDFRAASVDGTLGQNRMIQTVAAVLGIGVSEDENENGSGTEGETERDDVNQDLVITTAGLQSNSVASGKKATLVVSASLNAETIEVMDASGNLVESTTLNRNESSDEVLFKFMWRVYGTSGEKQVYTIRVKDADGKYSANTMTVTVTIR